MIVLDEQLRNRLGLTSDSVQLQVCSDYNFHSEEEFKINYWTKVFEAFSTYSSHLGPLSASTVRTWWGANVQPRTLPGLEKVLFQAVKEKKLISASDMLSRYHQLYRPVSSSVSIPRRAVSLIGSLARGVWNLTLGSEDADHSTDRVESEEIILVSDKVVNFSERILDELMVSSQLVTEADVKNCIERLAATSIEDINVHGMNEGYPFCRISANDVKCVVIAVLVEKFEAIPFIAGGDQKCVKLFRKTKDDVVKEVSEMDKAYIVSRSAIDRLTAREEELHKRWSSVDSTVREHLKFGRKNLALTALRERKMIEKQIDDCQIYKLKLQETSSMTETAVMQKLVVDAIAETSKAGIATLTGLEKNVQDVVDEANELREQVTEIGNVLGGGMAEDEDSLAEYEKLVQQLAADKEKEMGIRLGELAIPSVPSEAPLSPATKATVGKAPQILIEDS